MSFENVDGWRRMITHTISSPMSLQLKWAKKFWFEIHLEAKLGLDNLTNIQSSDTWISSWNKSEDGETLILPFTSKRQSVVQ